MSGPRSATVAFSWPRRQTTPFSVSSTTHSAFSSGAGVGGVEVDAAVRAAQLRAPCRAAASAARTARSPATRRSRRRRHRARPRRAARRQGRVGAVDRQSRASSDGPRTRSCGPRPRSTPRVGPGLPQRARRAVSPDSAGQASSAAGSPSAAGPVEARHAAPRECAPGPGADHQFAAQRSAPPACRTSCSSDQSGQVGTVAGQVGPRGHHVPQLPHLVGSIASQ